MARKRFKLCEPDCQFWHSKKQVMQQHQISASTLYAWIRDGLRVGRTGMIFCQWIREYHDRAPKKRGHDQETS
jgi:hypothetical protein